MKNISENKFLDKIEIHILYSITLPKIVPFMWTNIVEQGRPQMTIWRTRIACWVRKATNTHSDYVIFIAFPLQKW
jgi:hypothetical protein